MLSYLKNLGVTARGTYCPLHAFFSTTKTSSIAACATIWGYKQHQLFSRPKRAIRAAAIRGNNWANSKPMVKSLHRAGIEVILDVVYNHTPRKANHLGPTLSFRGVDNRTYYRLGGG